MTKWYVYIYSFRRWERVNPWLAAISVECLACVALSDEEPTWVPAGSVSRAKC